MDNTDFWKRLDELVAASRVVVDRPRGTAHPRYPEFIYPLDYGYLEDTRVIDGGGIDVWLGALPDRRITAVICTVDTVKRDTELKLLLGCTPDEARIILQIHNSGPQSAILIPRPKL
jgi:inorganic pyrophosphatase